MVIGSVDTETPKKAVQPTRGSHMIATQELYPEDKARSKATLDEVAIGSIIENYLLQQIRRCTYYVKYILVITSGR